MLSASVVVNMLLDVNGIRGLRRLQWTERWALAACLPTFSHGPHFYRAVCGGLHKRGMQVWKGEDYEFILIIFRNYCGEQDKKISGKEMEIQLHHYEEGREMAGMPLTFMCWLNRIWYLSTCYLLNSILMKTNTLDNSYIMNVLSKIIMLHTGIIKHYLKSCWPVKVGRMKW